MTDILEVMVIYKFQTPLGNYYQYFRDNFSFDHEIFRFEPTWAVYMRTHPLTDQIVEDVWRK